MNDNVWLTILLACLASGGVGVAAMGILKDYLAYRRERKAKKADAEADELKEWRRVTDETNAALREGMKFILYDRIRSLGKQYVFAGEIDLDDQKALHDMHKSYKKNGGNGDLDPLMHQVDMLPLKKG